MSCALLILALANAPGDAAAGEAAVQLTVQPMPAPKPALRYQLLPELRELKPGNPAQGYVKCFMEQRNFFFSKGSVSERTRYQSAPLADLAAKDLREYGGSALRQADWAARLDGLDWHALEHVQADGMNHQMVELPAMQVLAAALQVRFRGQVAGRHFDAAVASAKTMLALARHLGEYPSVDANLVGISIANLVLDTLEEMVQQKGCPNLYWALTSLPGPLVELRKGIQGSGALVATEFHPLRDDAVMTAAEMEKTVSHLSGVIGLAREQAGRAPRNMRAVLDARAKDAERVRAARGRLLDAGGIRLLVFRFPDLQLILLDERREYEVMRDERVKLLALAPWQIDAMADAAPASAGDGLFADLLPDILHARFLQGRLEQRIALLQHIEALRMYAANHDGKLPATLGEVSVPLPPDPFSGKPFQYCLDGATAHLRGGSPRHHESNGNSRVAYDVTIKK